MLATIYHATNDFFRARRILPALTPITCGSVSSPMAMGSDSLPVQISLFGRKVFLADSMQFQLEYILRQGHFGVYYVMPTFRGEDPGVRHLNQFFHAEAEVCCGHEELMALIEEYLRTLGAALLAGHAAEIAGAAGTCAHIERLCKKSWTIPRLSFKEAVSLLADDDRCFSSLPGGLKTISPFGERSLLEHCGGVAWVKRPPHPLVPFYQAYDSDRITAKSADLLMGIGEVVGSGERHTSYENLTQALGEHRVDPAEYAWYLRMKKEHPLRTSGFGLGLERFLLWVLKHDDIRDIPIFTRLKGEECCP